MRLLFTGAKGFLGKNIMPLLELNYMVTTMGLSEDNDIAVDLSLEAPLVNESFDVVLHAAGKAHAKVLKERESKDFFNINYLGTINLCKALERNSLPKAFIFISTVAVYGLESGYEIDEDYPLKGCTPYALSKIKAEKYLIDWCEKKGVLLGILRPSLIAGPNSKGSLGSMVKGIMLGRYFSISKGQAQKSVLMVQDVVSLMPQLIDKGGIYNICADAHPSLRELEVLISRQLNKKKPISIPSFVARIMALMGDLLGRNAPINSFKYKKITESLTFSNKKAKRELNWQPLDVISNYRIK